MHEDEPVSPDGPLATLISELGGDSLEDRGESFSIDRTLARKRLQEHQLKTPQRYVLGLVAAAVLKGASRLDFRLDGVDLFLSFDGRPFVEADFRDLFGTLLRGGSGPDAEALLELALAVNGAFALRTESFFLCSGDAGRGVHYELRSGDEERCTELPVEPPGTHLHVRTRFGALSRALAFLMGENRLEIVLRRHCKYASLPVRINGRRIAFGPALYKGCGVVPVETPHARGVAGFEPHLRSTGEVRLCKHGVWFATVTLPHTRAGFCAVVESARLKKDLSQADVVRDDALTEVLDAVAQAATAAVRALADEMAADELRDNTSKQFARALLREELVTTYERSPVRGPRVDPMVRALLHCRLWKGEDNVEWRSRFWSLAELLDRCEQGASIDWRNPDHDASAANVANKPPNSVLISPHNKRAKEYLKRIFSRARIVLPPRPRVT